MQNFTCCSGLISLFYFLPLSFMPNTPMASRQPSLSPAPILLSLTHTFWKFIQLIENNGFTPECSHLDAQEEFITLNGINKCKSITSSLTAKQSGELNKLIYNFTRIMQILLRLPTKKQDVTHGIQFLEDSV